MSSTTPRLDALRLWLADPTTEIDWPPPDYDPCAGMDDDERLDYAVAHAASGASAVLPIEPPQDWLRFVVPPAGRIRRARRQLTTALGARILHRHSKESA